MSIEGGGIAPAEGLPEYHPTVRLTLMILSEAVQLGYSRITIRPEPQSGILRVVYDGPPDRGLQERDKLPLRLRSSVVSCFLMFSFAVGDQGLSCSFSQAGDECQLSVVLGKELRGIQKELAILELEMLAERVSHACNILRAPVLGNDRLTSGPMD